MSDLRTRFERLWTGQDSVHDAAHHPFAHLNVLEEVAPGVAFYKGFVNIAVLDTEEGAVLIDTGSHALHALTFDSVRSWTARPIHTAVYTHGHIDHACGMPPFLAEARDKGWAQPRIVGHEAVSARMERYVETAGYNTVINSRQFGVPIRWPTEYVHPTETYARELDLSVGGQALQLRHARGETDDHTWVFLPGPKVLCTGDLFIWASPNAGNPQKVQRYCIEWARALRRMAACGAEVLLPGHGLPVFGAERVRTALLETADYLQAIYDQTLEMMNAGASVYDIVHGLQLPPALTERPFLQPVYDEPGFVARNVFRCLAGWYTGVPSELKPAPRAQQADELVRLAGGPGPVMARARALLQAGDARMACHLVDWLVEAMPDSREAHALRAEVFGVRGTEATSTMATGIFSAAQRESAARAGEPTGE